jgi:hypothetical protein
MKSIYRSLGGLMVAATVLTTSAVAQDAVPSAKDLAASLSAGIQDGSSEVRLKMEIPPANGNPKTVLQVRVKSRRSKAASEVVYQVLWPKEHKGEGFLLKQSGNRAASGTVMVLPNTLKRLSGSAMKDGIFGSDLAYVDVVENFYSWGDQSILGTEVVDRVSCVVLESKPGGSDSPYAKIQSWIDLKRMVPLRVDKYFGGGKLARRIMTTRVAKDDTGRQIPASFTVQRGGEGPQTIIEGSSSKHDVTLSDADFTPQAIGKLK